MSEATAIQPDLEFAQEIVDSGGEDVRKCFQCATCSVVCALSPEERPFPRKEMIWTQWGLKDRLFSDPDIWLCHNCNDCSVHCPRGAHPGDVLAILRKLAVAHYSVPGFLAGWVNRPAMLPLMALIPGLLLALAVILRDPIASTFGLATHHGEGMQYANLFPHWLLIGFFSFFLGLAVLLAGVGAIRFWRAMKNADRAADRIESTNSLGSSLITVVKDILTHQRFSKCTSLAGRRLAHLTAFYGFLALFLVSGWAVIVLYVINPLAETPLPYPFPFLDPAKLFANVGALALVVGCVIAIRDRLKDRSETGRSTDFDWMFLWLLFFVGITGILTEALRFAQAQTPGYIIYFIHLILAFMLLIYLPYSKFAHLVYRTVALVYAEHSGRGIDNRSEQPAQ